jgi:hypothetical protein
MIEKILQTFIEIFKNKFKVYYYKFILFLIYFINPIF